MLRLKPLPAAGGYDPSVCAASRCAEETLLIDGTQSLASCGVPLCEHHWEIRADLERGELEKKAAVVSQLKRREQVRGKQESALARQLSFRFSRGAKRGAGE